MNNILGKEEQLYQDRIKICRGCKLLTEESMLGEVCNSKLYLNPSTNTISSTNRPGFYKGCGCVLGSKTRVSNAHCPAGKW